MNSTNPHSKGSTLWWLWEQQQQNQTQENDDAQANKGMHGRFNGFDDILSGSAGSDEFSQFLKSLGIDDPNDLTEAQRQDWNKQLVDQLLAYNSELEKRKYNESLRDEQRLYDSPTAMLARLMASGLSRDAALAMLSGSGGSGGSAAPYTDGSQLAQGLAPSESQLNKIQGDTSIANTVFNGLSAITGLVNMGFGCAATKAQTSFMKAQNFLTGKQINAFNIASKAFSVLNGVNASIDAFGSVASAISAIQDAAASGDPAAVDFIQSGGIEEMRQNAPFVSRTLGQLYQDERSSKDYATAFSKMCRQQDADTDLTVLQYDALLEDIIKCKAEIEHIVTDTEFIEQNIEVAKKQADFIEAQAELARKQGRNVDADTLLKKAEKLRVDAETKSIELQNAPEDAFQNTVFGTQQERADGMTGLDWLTGSRLRQVYRTCKTLSKTTNEAYYNAAAAYELSDFETLTAVNALLKLRSESTLEYCKDHKETTKLGFALEDCGIGNLLNADVNTLHDIKFGDFQHTDRTNTGDDFLKELRRAKKSDKRKK